VLSTTYAAPIIRLHYCRYSAEEIISSGFRERSADDHEPSRIDMSEISSSLRICEIRDFEFFLLSSDRKPYTRGLSYIAYERSSWHAVILSFGYPRRLQSGQVNYRIATRARVFFFILNIGKIKYRLFAAAGTTIYIILFNIFKRTKKISER